MTRSVAWKAFERRVAKQLGGRRRGPDFRGQEGGKTDVIVEGLAVECKLLSRTSWCDFLGAVEQAERASAPWELPLAVVKKKRALDKDALVVMRLSTLVKGVEDQEVEDEQRTGNKGS